jgi:hypothetical protein
LVNRSGLTFGIKKIEVRNYYTNRKVLNIISSIGKIVCLHQERNRRFSV